MKKILFILLIVSLSSCLKTRHCSCSIVYKSSGTDAGTYIQTIGRGYSKKKAKSECDKYDGIGTIGAKESNGNTYLAETYTDCKLE